MNAEPLRKDDVQAQNSPRRNFVEVYQNAGKAFHLIDKYQTPPFPSTYSLWYAYVSGADDQLVARVDEVLAKHGELSAYEIEEIVQANLAQDSNETARQNIGIAFEKEMESVLQIIQEGVKRSDSFRSTLTDAGDKLPNSMSSDDLKGLVSGLMEENRRMAEVTQELNDGLIESQKQIATLNKELQEVQNQCMRDSLTAVSNRRAFDKRVLAEVNHAEQSGEKLCLAFADIDHFKRLNDTYGHQSGDAVLQMFAAIIDQNIKGQDMVARYGGEEFAIILPRTDILGAYNLMVKIKHSFEKAELTIMGNNTRISGYGLLRNLALQARHDGAAADRTRGLAPVRSQECGT